MVHEILEELKGSNPFTPIKVLSPLAEGADRIVARVAIKMGVPLIVPLPHPEDHYLLDFAHEDSRSEFRALLAEAESSFVVEKDCCSIPKMEQGTTTDQDMGYARVGLYVGINSHLLLTFWDGAENDKPGGTFQTFNYRLNGSHQLVPLYDDNVAAMETGWVVRIPTPRISVPGSTIDSAELLRGGHTLALHTGSTWDKLKLKKKLLSRNMQALRCLEAFNKDVASNSPSPDQISQSLAFFPSDTLELQQFVASNPVIQWFARADQLAIRCQYLHKLELIWMYLGTFMVFSLFNIYSNLLHSRTILGFFIATMALFIGSFLYIRHLDHHRKYLDYRALAEGLRVQMFWDIAEINEEAAAHYLSHQVGELDWIRLAMRSIRLQTSYLFASAKGMRWDLAKKHWLEDQRQYQFKAAMYAGRKERQLRWITRTAFGLGLCLTIILFLTHGVLTPLGHDRMIAAIGFFTPLSAVVVAYGQKRAYAEKARQAHGMGELLSCWIKKIQSAEKCNKPERISDLIRDIGRSSLQENGDWVLLYRMRELEIPK